MRIIFLCFLSEFLFTQQIKKSTKIFQKFLNQCFHRFFVLRLATQAASLPVIVDSIALASYLLYGRSLAGSSVRKLNTCRQQMNTTNSRTAQTRISVAKNFCIIVPWPGAFLLLWNSLKKVGFYLIRFHLTDHHFLSAIPNI